MHRHEQGHAYGWCPAQQAAAAAANTSTHMTPSAPHRRNTRAAGVGCVCVWRAHTGQCPRPLPAAHLPRTQPTPACRGERLPGRLLLLPACLPAYLVRTVCNDLGQEVVHHRRGDDVACEVQSAKHGHASAGTCSGVAIPQRRADGQGQVAARQGQGQGAHSSSCSHHTSAAAATHARGVLCRRSAW